MSSVFAEILTRIIHEERYSVSELAGVAGCSASYLYKVMDEEKDIAFGKAQRISRYISFHGDQRLAALMLTTEYEIRQRSEIADPDPS